MNRKPVKIIVLVSLAVLLVAAWHVAEARGRKKKKVVLPRAAVAAIKKAFPNAKIVKVEEEPHVLLIYEVEMIRDGKEIEAEVFVNGEILAVEKQITKSDLPKAVARTLAAEAKGAEIKELEQKEIRATIAISRFAKPKMVYEAEFVKNGKTIEVEIDAKGKVLKREIEDEDDDDDEDEVEVSIDQVPAAVKATILKHAGKNKIHEIEKETKRGKTVYEAEWRENGKEIEIKVASDGKLLSKEIDDDDDDDDDDHDDDDDDD